MSIVPLIQALNEEEQHKVLKFLQQHNQRGDVKNIQLFNSIRKGKTEKLDEKIYGKPSKNAFYALCSRLQENIIEVVAANSFSGETSEEIRCLKCLLASRIFFEKQLYPLAVKTLQRSENLAKKFELYSILNEVYHTKIQYAQHQNKITLTRLFEEAKHNLEAFQNEFRLNMAYAEIETGLRQNPLQNSKDLIEKTFFKLQIQAEETLTYKSLFQLLSMLSEAAKQQSDYFKILNYASKLFNIVKKKAHFVEKHEYYYLHILSLMANIYFRTKRFEDSLSLLEDLQNKSLDPKNSSFVMEDTVLLTSLNLIYTNQLDAAITNLEQTSLKTPNLNLTLAVCFILQEEPQKAYAIIKEFQHSDHWYEKKIDLLWVIKKNLIHLIVLIELEKVDLVYQHFQSFYKRFGTRLKNAGEERILQFTKLVKAYYDHPEESNSEKLKHQLETSFLSDPEKPADILMLGFYAWIKSKVYQEEVYQVLLKTLDFTSQNKSV
ncbi:hypothetical protein [Mesonia sp.]|uniref:hypothetical protein n=1 Tax=Mesonia sp. TaxID=1960830 RepID=UPI003F98C49A